MTLISSRLFFDIWKQITNDNKQVLLDQWQNYKNYTSLIKGSENSILSQIAIKLNLFVYEKDYYSVDAIFFNADDLCPKIQDKTYWFRNLQIAFEHENNFYSGLYQEISHLIILNSPLKVLVTYPDNIEHGEKELEYFTEIIKGNRNELQFSEKEEILVIYGFREDFSWHGYIYKSEGWLKL
jgi:hypothetical protein